VISVAQTFSEVWEGVGSLLAEMDVLLGFAELAVNAPMPYVRPEMLPADAGEIVLEGSRYILPPYPSTGYAQAHVPAGGVLCIGMEMSLLLWPKNYMT
jgi:hypothetical protein